MSKELVQDVLKAIKKAAKVNGIEPYDVKLGDLEDITEWQCRKLGGLASIKRRYFPEQDKELAVIVDNKNTSAYLAKLEKAVGSRELFETRLMEAVTTGIASLKVKKFVVSKPKASAKNKMTLELMVSDVHYGKKTDTFDLDVCRTRMQKLTEVFLSELAIAQRDFNVHRIIISLLGDIIESYTMHGMESALSSEFSNTVQIKEAIESLFYDVILPVAKTGIKIDIPAVTGNHDRVEHNKTMHNPGETNLTWIIYNALELLIKQSGLKNVTMHIPKNSYALLTIYNNNILFEHLDNVKAPTEDNFEKHIQRRSQQIGKVIHFLRGGHWHKYLCFGRGRIIVNECVPGQDSYANVKGYDTQAGQTINYYVETDDRPNCFYKSFPVYLK